MLSLCHPAQAACRRHRLPAQWAHQLHRSSGCTAAPAAPQRAARQLWQVTNTGAICIAKSLKLFSKKSLNWKIPVLNRLIKKEHLVIQMIVYLVLNDER